MLTSVCEDGQALSKKSFSDMSTEALKDFLETIEKMKSSLDLLGESLKKAAEKDSLSCRTTPEKGKDVMEDAVNEMG